MNDDQPDVVPPAGVLVVEADDFLPIHYIIPVLREDGDRCVCGIWQFYSSQCDHLYQTYDARCGATRNQKNTRTTFCPKTASRILISNVQVNAPCPYPVCQDRQDNDEAEA
jgi:hypothetical protein